METNSVEYVFDVVSTQLPKAGVEFLMIGGHAVNHYGFSRATVDVDFMIVSNDVATVREVMKTAGFTNVSDSDNVIFFGHPENPHRVDFLKIEQDSMDKLIKSAEVIDYSGYRLKVPGISDLIAMKLFAVSQGSLQREEKDLLDVVNLVQECGLDLKLIRELCDRYASDDVYSKVESRMSGEEKDG
ncbi:nucleotidyl transferase AbiEii/AbiGii toxin family protein [Pontiella agarivorans]|uniref:Nucleotidyl transferase AbiEii/AbiGii toxin family protein n=1 Tax=Pontiella agarivorans TaxID=3038953 RepID=A0ABU5MYW1_9BACT|nr:nucleotidyl transferase AbiEii/AbiGii toxin family protein [Pontiella agarivorans]MDZ8119368.1 nucleotidyl transferase AbiEii/AbiGii toxin family protein [Pontiella agarivorans]